LGKIDAALAALQRLLLPNMEVRGQQGTKNLRMIVLVLIFLIGEEALHHLILPPHELDHERGSKTREPADEVGQGNVCRDDDVVQERETKREFWPSAGGQILALQPQPPLRWRGIRQV